MTQSNELCHKLNLKNSTVFKFRIKTKLKPLCKTKTKLKLKPGHSKLTQSQQKLKLLSERCNTCSLPHEQETSVKNASLIILHKYWYNPLTVPNWFGMALYGKLITQTCRLRQRASFLGNFPASVHDLTSLVTWHLPAQLFPICSFHTTKTTTLPGELLSNHRRRHKLFVALSHTLVSTVSR